MDFKTISFTVTKNSVIFHIEQSTSSEVSAFIILPKKAKIYIQKSAYHLVNSTVKNCLLETGRNSPELVSSLSNNKWKVLP